MNKILNGKVNFPLCLAPMVGISHVAMRQVIRTYLPENAFTIWPTEMLNSRRIPNENLSLTPETLRAENETGLVPQILGNEEGPIADSVQKLIQWGAEGIDINMGCPVQKALKHNYGVSLMGDADYAAHVVRITVKNSSVPVSVKLRAAGSKEENDFDFLVEFTNKLEDAGASWLCLHPRTADQKRRGNADWSQIKKLKKVLNIPLIGNGDIQISDDVFKMLDETNCDLVMAGRALAARPWMMWQVGEKLGMSPPINKSGKAPTTSEEEGAEYGKCLLLFIDECEKYFSPDLALRKIRFYIRTTHVWLKFGHSLVSISTQSKSLPELKDRIQNFFAAPAEMESYTQLRQ